MDNKIRIRKDGDFEKLFCLVRKKWILLTAEELVRQKFVLQLLRLGFSEGLIAVEQPFSLDSGKSLRADIIVYNNKGRAQILIECKADEVAINEEVFRQASKYNSYFKAPYIVLTNCRETLLFYSDDFINYRRLKIEELPISPNQK